MKAVEDYKALSEGDLQVRRAEVMRDLMVTQFQLHTGQLENTTQPGILRKRLARINTELRQREIADGVAKGTYLNRTSARPGEAAAAVAPSTEGGAAPAKRSRFGLGGLGALRDALLGKRS